MKIKVEKNLTTFKKIITFIGKIGSETNIVFKEEGISIMVTGDGNTACSIKFNKDFFEEYEGEGKFGIIITDLNNLLKKAVDSVTIEEHEDRLLIKSGRMKAYAPLISDIEGYDKMPEIITEYKVDLTMLKLTEALDQLALIKPDEVEFEIREKKLYLKCENGLRTMEIELMDTEDIKLNVSIGMAYLMYLCSKTSDIITLHLKDATPLLATYTKDGAELEYFVAPRIGNNK